MALFLLINDAKETLIDIKKREMIIFVIKFIEKEIFLLVELKITYYHYENIF